MPPTPTDTLDEQIYNVFPGLNKEEIVAAALMLQQDGPSNMNTNSNNPPGSTAQPAQAVMTLDMDVTDFSDLTDINFSSLTPTIGGSASDKQPTSTSTPPEPALPSSRPSKAVCTPTDSSAKAIPEPGPSIPHYIEDDITDEFGLSSGPLQPTYTTSKPPANAKGKSDKEPQPAWSELKTKAGKERKRLPLACIACRRKKIRCSGEKPACKHCLRSRIPCVYKVTTRKAAPRTDYMAMLDKRLKRMEERIIKAVPKSDDAYGHSVSRAVVKPAIPGAAATAAAKEGAAGGSKKRAADEAFGGEVDCWMRVAGKGQEGPQSSAVIQEPCDDKLFLEGREVLPDREIQEHLAEVFFDNIYGQAYHILHKPSYMRKLRARTLPPVLILSVCAVSARFSTHPRVNTTPNFLRGEEWAEVARKIVITRYEWPNITILICLLILGLHEFGTCHGGRSWALGGQAMRMAYALQLHRDLAHDPASDKPQLSFVDREIRRRTMWACFLMDRLNSSGTDRPMFILEESVKIPLPVKESFFQLDVPALTENLRGDVPSPLAAYDGPCDNVADNMGVAAHTIRVIALWGQIITYVNLGGKDQDIYPIYSPESGYAKLAQEAEDLLMNLPESLTYSSENIQLHRNEGLANQFIFMHITIQQNMLFLSRILLGKPPSLEAEANTPQDFVTRVQQKAFATASQVSELLKDAESYFVTAPFAGYVAFSSATIHILGIFSGDSELAFKSKGYLETNLKYLARMKRYWGMFHWMSENLREQYRTYAEAAAQGALKEERATATPIVQYGDWFDRYPHGVANDSGLAKTKRKSEDAALEQKPELHTVQEFFTALIPSQNSDNTQPPLKKKASARKDCDRLRDNQTPQADTPGSSGVAIQSNMSSPMLREQSQTELRKAFSTFSQTIQVLEKDIYPHPSGDPVKERGLMITTEGTPFEQPLEQQQTHDQPMTQVPSLPTTATQPIAHQQALQPQQQQARPQPQTQISQATLQNPHQSIGSPQTIHTDNPFNKPSQHQQHASSFFPSANDMFNISLSQSGNIVQPLDRQLVLNAYTMDLGINANNLPGATQPHHQHQHQHQVSHDWSMNPLHITSQPQPLAHQPQPQPIPQHHLLKGTAMPVDRRRPMMNNAQISDGSSGAKLSFGPEASSAWFMPFNMEPPDVGSEMALGVSGMETFGGIFAGGIGSFMNWFDEMNGGDGG